MHRKIVVVSSVGLACWASFASAQPALSGTPSSPVKAKTSITAAGKQATAPATIARPAVAPAPKSTWIPAPYWRAMLYRTDVPTMHLANLSLDDFSMVKKAWRLSLQGATIKTLDVDNATKRAAITQTLDHMVFEWAQKPKVKTPKATPPQNPTYMQIKADQLSYEADNNRANPYRLWLGESAFHAKQVTLSTLQKKVPLMQLQLTGLGVKGKGALVDNAMDFSVDINIDAMQHGALQLKNIKVGMDWQGLNPAEFAKLIQPVKHDGAYFINANPDNAKALLASGFTFHIKQLQFDSNHGAFDGNLLLQMPVQPKGQPVSPLLLALQTHVAADLTVSQTLFQFVLTSIVQANQHAPAKKGPSTKSTASVAGRVATMLHNALQQGWLVEDGDNYKMKLDFTHGILTVNGKTIRAGATMPPALTPTPPPVK